MVMVVVAARPARAPSLGEERTGWGGGRTRVPLLSPGVCGGEGEGGYSGLVAPGELGSCLIELLLLRAAAAAPTVWLRV